MVNVIQIEALFILEPNAHPQLQRRPLPSWMRFDSRADEHKFWSCRYFWLGAV